MITEAIILAGGLGTRLRSSVPAGTPKVLAMVKGKPFLFHLIKLIEKKSDITKVILSLGYEAQKVIDYLPLLESRLRIEYVIEDQRLGTAGGAANCLPLVEKDNVFVLNGDSYSELDLREMSSFHEGHKALITMALVEVDDVSRYGSVVIDDRSRIVEFREKQDRAERGLVNTGVYVVSREVLESIPPGKDVSFEREIFPSYVNGSILGFHGVSRFIDIGTELSFIDAQYFEY